VFAPLENIGLIVIDEEHDTSYKQDEGLTYHAKALAMERALVEGSVSVLGSATPSLESYEAASRGVYELLELPTRATSHDIRPSRWWIFGKNFRSTGKGIVFCRTPGGDRGDVGAGEQTVLFLNRRGFAPLVLCPKCGESLRCPDCSVTLTYHKELKKHLCHYCDYTAELTEACPKCGEMKFIFLGVGTERVEQELGFHFPDARLVDWIGTRLWARGT